MKIYAVGCLKIKEGEIQSSRLWWLFSSFERAEDSILSNDFDIFEHYYNYALIEEVQVVDLYSEEEKNDASPLHHKEFWYRGTYDKVDVNTVHVESTEKPEFLSGTCNFFVC